MKICTFLKVGGVTSHQILLKKSFFKGLTNRTKTFRINYSFSYMSSYLIQNKSCMENKMIDLYLKNVKKTLFLVVFRIKREIKHGDPHFLSFYFNKHGHVHISEKYE